MSQAPSDAVASTFTLSPRRRGGGAYLLSGRIDGAAQQVERALGRARREQERGYEALGAQAARR